VFNDAVNSPLLVQGGHHLVDMALMYTSPTQNWSATFAVKNVTDKVYLVSGYVDTFGGLTEGHYARPREWSLNVRYEF